MAIYRNLSGTNREFICGRLTTAQRNALTVVDGTILYNTTTDQFERYQGGSWGAFAGGSGITSIVQDTTPTLGGDLSSGGFDLLLADSVISRPEIQDYSITNDAGSFGSGTLTLDYPDGPDFEFTLSANISTLTITNWPPTGRLGKVSLALAQPTSGTFTVSFAGIDFGDAGAPAMTTGTGARIEVVVWSRDAGSTLFGGTSFINTGS